MGTMKSHVVFAVTVVSFCCWCFLFSVVECRYRGADGGVRYVGYKSNYNDGGGGGGGGGGGAAAALAPVFNNLQRRDWCARWGDYCVPESKVRFANCCSGLRCVCGTFLWNPGKCQCKKSSLFGR